MPPYWWLLLVPSLYRCVLCSDSCGETKSVVSEESGDVLLPVERAEITEISWILRNTLIAITKSHNSVETKGRQFKNRLYNGTNGSLNITGLTKDDQGEYIANIRWDPDQSCNQNYNLTVYSKLSKDDIKIHHNVTWNGTCKVTLRCAVNKPDVSVTWTNSVNGTVQGSPTLQVTDPDTNSSWTCTASHSVANVSRTVIPLDFCQNETKVVTIVLGVFGALVLFTVVAIICRLCYLWKEKKNICSAMKWNKKGRPTSTSDGLQPTDNVYWEIDQTKEIHCKPETSTRIGTPKINSIYMKVKPVKTDYRRGDLLQGDDNSEMYCD